LSATSNTQGPLFKYAGEWEYDAMAQLGIPEFVKVLKILFCEK
jgi:hypothetical protein